jgi:hypothetical protein
MSAGTAPYKLFKKIIRRNVHGYVFIYKLCRAVYYIIGAKHLSKAWRATVQVGEVRIIAFRPAGHTEVDYLIKVQAINFCRLRSVSRNNG